MAALVLGTHTYDASADARRRQEDGVAALRALEGVDAVNVQFTDGGHEAAGVPTLRALDRDANSVTGRRGPRKPLVADVFNAIWREAIRRRASHFGFTNADILVSGEAVAWALGSGREACILAREDFDGATGRALGIGLYGADVFIIATDCWARHRRRFRGYILGEAVWDNVYAAVLMCHADAVIENRRPLVRHEAHPQKWTTAGPFADYQRLLASRDATYFSMWCEYATAIAEMRRCGSPVDEEEAMARRTFRWPPPPRARVIQALRTARALVRYGRARVRRG